jgi:NAD+ synthase
LAHYLGVPQEIISRTPTSDTYSAEQTQEEFFFQLPFQQMDLLWFAFKNEYNPQEVGDVMGRTVDEIKKVFAGFERKIKTARYLRMPPISY